MSRAVVLVLVLAACDTVYDLHRPEFGPWSVPVGEDAFLIGVGDDPTLRGDLTELIWNDIGSLYVTRRASASVPWPGVSEPIPELESASLETTPRLAPDGLLLLFASNRPGGMGGHDLYMTERASFDAPWGTPALIPELSSPASDLSATITADRLVLVFASRRPGVGVEDLFYTERATATDPWGAPESLDTINSADLAETDPALSADGLELFLTIKTPGNYDLFVSRRARRSEPFGSPEPIDEINRANHNDEDSWISPDGHDLFFMRDVNTPTAALMHVHR